MFYGHNAMGDQEITLGFARIGGAGANQRESIIPKADVTVNWLNTPS